MPKPKKEQYVAFFAQTQDTNHVKGKLDALADQANAENRIIRQLNVSNQGTHILISAFLEKR